MRKHSNSLDTFEDPPPRRRLPRRVVALLLIVTGAPFLYEGGLLCLGNWRSVMGGSTVVHTPVLDASYALLERVRDELSGLVPAAFLHIPWQPSHVLLVGAAAMAVSMRLLRR